MGSVNAEHPTHPPDPMTFTILKGATASTPRLGRLAIPGRKALETPGYISIASRGVIAHLSPDNHGSKTRIGGAYLALEDFVERPPNKVPLYQYRPPDGSSPLRSFCAFPDDTLLVLGARRTQAVPDVRPNTVQSITLWTAFGARELPVKEYVEAIASLRPDIAIGPADILHGLPKPGKARAAKMGDRSEAWLSMLTSAVKGIGAGGPALFLPVLPIAKELQQRYLETLQEEGQRNRVQGVALYDHDSVSIIPSSLAGLPRLTLTEPSNPSDILRAVATGVDILTIPFIGAATDAGIALTFSFGTVQQAKDRNDQAPLGIDMHDDAHTNDVSPILHGCECYACTNHHRAYIHHLLATKEMLAWVLLQIHNHHVVDDFFTAVRHSIRNGTFAEQSAAFDATHESSMPTTSGQGPRARGYQFKSEGFGESKKNEKAYNRLDAANANLGNATTETKVDHAAESLKEGVELGPDVAAIDLEKAGLGKKI